MKQKCSECKSIVEICDEEYVSGSTVYRKCPRCGAAVVFHIPLEEPRRHAGVASGEACEGPDGAAEAHEKSLRPTFVDAIRPMGSGEGQPAVCEPKTMKTIVVDDVSFAMVFVKGGTFMMGGAPRSRAPMSKVTKNRHTG